MPPDPRRTSARLRHAHLQRELHRLHFESHSLTLTVPPGRDQCVTEGLDSLRQLDTASARIAHYRPPIRTQGNDEEVTLHIEMIQGRHARTLRIIQGVSLPASESIWDRRLRQIRVSSN